MLIGEGTSDIQTMIIGRRLLTDYHLGLVGASSAGFDLFCGIGAM
jgi:hypothetical protein